MWRMRRAAALAWIPPLLLSCTLAHAQAGPPGVTVRIAGQDAMAPKWVRLRNRVAGICPDLLAAIERVEPRLHFTGYRQSRSLPGIEAGLEAGSLDVGCALAPSPRRQAVAQQVGPVVYYLRHRLAARSGDTADIRSVDDLVRLRALVASQRGGVYTEELKKAGVIVDDASDDNGLNLRKMLAGHGRFVEMNEMTLRHYLQAEDLAQRVRVLPIVLKEEPSYFWVSRKADPAIARLLGPALDKLKASGELDRIYALRAANP